MSAAPLHLSAVAGSRLLDAAGDSLGRVQDVIVRLDTGEKLPPVTGLKARIGGRELFVPAERIATLEPACARLSTTKLDVGQFERRPGEVLLRADVLGHSLIYVQTAQLVRAQEVELQCVDGRWRVVGIDPSWRARLRRVLPRRRRVHEAEHEYIGWDELEPFVGHVPSARLKLRRIARLHPAQIADLVEAATHEEGEEIMEAVGHDRELEADVFEELDDEHQIEFLRERSDAEVAAVLAEMNPDDAADLLLQLEQERRLPVLELMPPAQRRKIRVLLGYNPETAGGLMTPDFLALPSPTTVTEALAAVRRSELTPELLYVIFATDAAGTLAGALSIVELCRADPSAQLAGLVQEGYPSVPPDADVPEIARVMTDYNLISLPVVDGDGRVIGTLTVDDVLELTLPSDWRRRFGLARG